jgi:hypothetical protein
MTEDVSIHVAHPQTKTIILRKGDTIVVDLVGACMCYDASQSAFVFLINHSQPAIQTRSKIHTSFVHLAGQVNLTKTSLDSDLDREFVLVSHVGAFAVFNINSFILPSKQVANLRR